MTEFDKSYDVLVAGAGVAGVAAAVASARMGLRTALVEKTVLLGGLATTGLIDEYTPLCDGCGHLVTRGLAQEMLHLSLRYGPGDVPDGWRLGVSSGPKRRYMAVFAPAAFVLAMDELIEEAGVDLWLDTLICEPVTEGRRVVGLEVENKSGRGVLRGRCVVDGTGDADVAHRAGAPCEAGEDWLSFVALETSLERARKAVQAGSAEKLVSGTLLGANWAGKGHPDGVPLYSGVDGRQVTDFVLSGRRMLRQRYADQQARLGAEGRKQHYPVTLPAMAQFRTTRRIVGETTMADGMPWRHFDDSVGLVACWLHPGEVWEVPYGALLPREVTGLVATGRCMAVAGHAWDVMRVIHAAVHTGEIAGVAAAIAVKAETTPDALEVAIVRAELERRGIAHDSREIPRVSPQGTEGPCQQDARH
jgi:hypothetical protein